jgi:hypothetical protein
MTLASLLYLLTISSDIAKVGNCKIGTNPHGGINTRNFVDSYRD